MKTGRIGLATRVLTVGSLLLSPFLSHLARNGYSWWRPEAMVGIGWLAAVSGGMAAAAAGGTVFAGLVVLLVGVEGAGPVSRMLSPWWEAGPWMGFAIAAAAGGAVLATMREKGYAVIAAVAAGSLAEAYLARPDWNAGPGRVVVVPKGRPGTLYLILDEHLGPAGFPREIPACGRASDAIVSVLTRQGFTVYTHAYSNYPITLDSVSSVLNRRLLAHSRELVEQSREGARVYVLRENRLAEEMEARGERVWVCGHRSIRLTAGRRGDVLYEDWLGELQEVEGSWTRKAEWIIGGLQAADPAAGRVNAFFPFRVGPRGPGPLSLRGIWPERVAAEVGGGGLALVHLLSPHGPYVYRADGRIRRMEEWAGDRTDRRLPRVEYEARYARYCEQVEHLSGELDGFFDRLRSADVLDGLRVVVHGDHGSRIRLAGGGGSREEVASPERFDYQGEPGLRDLLDRFSTLAAIKEPGQREARVDGRKDSLLRILEREYYGGDPERWGAAAERVYLFEESGMPVPIEIKAYWR